MAAVAGGYQSGFMQNRGGREIVGRYDGRGVGVTSGQTDTQQYRRW